jgi:pantoate--beta-alanine ligase
VELIRAATGVRNLADGWRSDGLRVGLVPTMGALHAGHASLIEQARARTHRVVVTIFVDAVWAPPVGEVYPPGMDLTVPDVGPVGLLFEGAARPAHFIGVLTVVRRLFDVVGPCDAFFGEKDAQQLFLIRRMVSETPELRETRIAACPTAREPDGLAMSSRNAYLGPQEREQAGCLFLALTEAAERARAGERDPAVLVAAMAREIGATPLARLDYAAVVDEATFEPPVRIDGPARAIVAARFPSARLIDTLALPGPGNA